MANILDSQWAGATILDNAKWDSEQGTTGALTVATDQFLQGTQSLKFNRNGSTSNYVQRAITSISTCGIRHAVRINTIGSTEVGPINLMAGATAVYSLGFNPTEFSVFNVNRAGYVGSNYTFTVDTWYQIEILFVAGTSIKWKVWNASGTTLLHSEQTDTVSVNGSNVDSIRVGAAYVADAGNNIFWLDSFIADNSVYPGPYYNSVPINYLRV